MQPPTQNELEIIEQIAANLQRMEWAAAAVGQPQLSNLIDLALLQALDLLNAASPENVMMTSSPSAVSVDYGEKATLESDKIRENRLRRVAKRRGLRLLKSRLKDPKAVGFGGFMLIDVGTNVAVLGEQPYKFSCSLETIESFLNHS